jgi:hypothetical protein
MRRAKGSTSGGDEGGSAQCRPDGRVGQCGMNPTLSSDLRRHRPGAGRRRHGPLGRRRTGVRRTSVNSRGDRGARWYTFSGIHFPTRRRLVAGGSPSAGARHADHLPPATRTAPPAHARRRHGTGRPRRRAARAAAPSRPRPSTRPSVATSSTRWPPSSRATTWTRTPAASSPTGCGAASPPAPTTGLVDPQAFAEGADDRPARGQRGQAPQRRLRARGAGDAPGARTASPPRHPGRPPGRRRPRTRARAAVAAAPGGGAGPARQLRVRARGRPPRQRRLRGGPRLHGRPGGVRRRRQRAAPRAARRRGDLRPRRMPAGAGGSATS